MTHKSFRDDVYLKELDAVVTSIALSPKRAGCLLVTLDRTVFFPTGGGQSCDLGTLAGLPVIDVFEDADEIVHVVQLADTAAVSASASPLQAGDQVHIAIDWARRFDNMQRHCGEHILSGIFYGLYGGVNRGFHMGDDYMTIDISLEDDPAFTEVTWEMAEKAELETNRVIWQNLPVTTFHFDTREEAEKMPLRKKLAIERDITIVTIGDPSKPADSVACCGTHPATAGQVGLVKLYKVEPNKGMFRIFFEAGERAFRQYQQTFDTMTALEKDLSAGTGDLMKKYLARKEKNHEVRDRLYKLTKTVSASESARILAAAATGEDRFSYEILSLDDLMELGRSLTGHNPGLLFLVHEPSLTALLFSDSADCGRLVKDNVAVFSGKGGGGKQFARAIFSRPDDLDTFIDAIRKLRR